MTTPIWFDSTETGAPTLNNVAGSLLEVLRACLINGFGAKTVTSIDVVSGVATATAASHGFSATFGKRLLIAGSGEAALNGTKQPLSVATNTFTFDATGVADGTYTGTMSAKRAPLGWTEPHTGTNVAIFARSDPEATAMMLRVNDSHAGGSTATDARVIAVESATGVDAYTGPSPSEAQVAGGGYVQKGANSATAKPWVVVGDGRFVWIFTAADTTLVLSAFYFGDGVPYFTPDAYFTVLTPGSSAGSGSQAVSTGGLTRSVESTTFTTQGYASRARSGLGASVLIAPGSPGTSPIGATGGQTSTDNVAIHYPVYLVENDGAKTIRGHIPGLHVPLAFQPFTHLQLVTGVGPASKTLLSLRHQRASSQGNLLLDLTGPWY